MSFSLSLLKKVPYSAMSGDLFPLPKRDALVLLKYAIGNPGDRECRSTGGKHPRKLADFLRNGYFTPLGRCELCESSVKIVTTSSADLAQLVSAGKFNQELYDLLAPQTLAVPPLNKRKKDIRLIVQNRIEHYNKLFDKKIKDIDSEAYNKLMAYDWPGNTDELERGCPSCS